MYFIFMCVLFSCVFFVSCYRTPWMSFYLQDGQEAPFANPSQTDLIHRYLETFGFPFSIILHWFRHFVQPFCFWFSLSNAASFLVLLLITPTRQTSYGLRNLFGLAVVLFGFTISFVRTEGLGPFEAQDVWDEKGRSNVFPVFKAIQKTLEKDVEIFEVFINKTMEVLEHPLEAIYRREFGIFPPIFLTVFVLFLVVTLSTRILWPILKFVWLCLKMVFRAARFTLAYLKDTGYVMSFCALTPFRRIRDCLNAREIRRRNRRLDEEVACVLGEVPINMITRVHSHLNYDVHGPYLTANDNSRVYCAKPSDAAILVTSPPARIMEGVVKEAMIATSPLYRIDKMPPFQGCFKVNGTVVGQFSRITFMEKDCILTASHVFEYNESAIITLCNGPREVFLHDVRSKIVVWSPRTQMDFCIIQFPSAVFSQLGLKQGKIATSLIESSAVSICQYHEGTPCKARALATVFRAKPWHIKYAASTNKGTSGAPILDCHQRIVGVHLEAHAEFNVGVIPPVFRKNYVHVKESLRNNDIMDQVPDIQEDEEELRMFRFFRAQALQEIDDSHLEERFERDEEYYAYMYDDDYDFDYDADVNGYALEMARLREEAERLREQYQRELDVEQRRGGDLDELPSKDSAYRRGRVFVARTGATGSHVNQKIKGGRYRKEAQLPPLQTALAEAAPVEGEKESPKTCPKCNVVYQKGYDCTICGRALANAKTIVQDKRDAVEAGLQKAGVPVVVQDGILNIVETQAKVDLLPARLIENVLDGSNLQRPITDESRLAHFREQNEILREIAAMEGRLLMVIDKKLKTFLDTQPIYDYSDNHRLARKDNLSGTLRVVDDPDLTRHADVKNIPENMSIGVMGKPSVRFRPWRNADSPLEADFVTNASSPTVYDAILPAQVVRTTNRAARRRQRLPSNKESRYVSQPNRDFAVSVVRNEDLLPGQETNIDFSDQWHLMTTCDVLGYNDIHYAYDSRVARGPDTQTLAPDVQRRQKFWSEFLDVTENTRDRRYEVKSLIREQRQAVSRYPKPVIPPPPFKAAQEQLNREVDTDYVPAVPLNLLSPPVGGRPGYTSVNPSPCLTTSQVSAKEPTPSTNPQKRPKQSSGRRRNRSGHRAMTTVGHREGQPQSLRA
jgi:hypothetical protein